MAKSEALFFELLRISLGRQKAFSRMPSAAEWTSLYSCARNQSLVGVCYTAIERLPLDQRPPRGLLLQWYALMLRIEARNRLANRRAIELCSQLESDGYQACVIKGPGVAMLYPDSLRRECGDIDVWVRTANGSLEADRRQLITYVRSRYATAEVCYHHADYPMFGDIPVELHFMPTRLYSPWHNQRLQKWFEQERRGQFIHRITLPEGELTVPTDRFNAVYLLLHIAKHILEEGVGLRQLMDYYWLLMQDERPMSAAEFQRLLGSWGLMKVARAVNYVLQEVFGIETERCLCESDVRLGRYLLNEIMLAGNFGHSDPRFGNLQDETPWQRFVRKQTRVFHFMRFSPSETLCSPFFSIYQRAWRKRRHLI